MAASPRLSIVIKAYNEEAKIASAIESALGVEAHVSPLEVVVADSASTDRTVEIASRYPVRVVQLERPSERGCGIGVELGFRHARGEYVYFLDGDMVLYPDFIVSALDVLVSDPGLGGVGGLVQDTRIANDIDRIRVNNKAVTRPGECRWLEGGGLYRRSAIESAGGYAANRNLKGYEEAELGMRLRNAGWRLTRLTKIAVSHTGHDANTWQLLGRHWRSRRAMSGGVLLRSALGQRWLPEVCSILKYPLVIIAWWAIVLPLVLWLPLPWMKPALAGWLALPLVAFLAVWLKKRDPRHALLSIVDWHYSALATLIGFFSARQRPTEAPAARLVRDTIQPAGQP
jgi:glycosyltransferase involved in cell wall biosynthesis